MSPEHATQFYIGGQWRNRSSPTRIAVVDPASEAVIGEIAAGGPEDVDLAVAAARRAFESFSRTSVVERVGLLARILELIEARAEAFAQAMVLEMGAAVSFARAAQVPF